MALIDAEYCDEFSMCHKVYRVVVKDCVADSCAIIFYRLYAQTQSNGWIIREITAQETARVDRAGFHMRRGPRADDFLRWLHKKAVDLPASPARSDLLRLLIDVAQK